MRLGDFLTATAAAAGGGIPGRAAAVYRRERLRAAGGRA